MVVSNSTFKKENNVKSDLNNCINEVETQFASLGIDNLEKCASDFQKLKNQNEALSKSIQNEMELNDKIFPPLFKIIGNFISFYVSPYINHPDAEYFVQEVRSKSPKSDLVCPIAMKLFKILPEDKKKQLNISSVMDLAQFISQIIPENDIFKITNVESPGMIQINIHPNFIIKSVNKLVKFGILPPSKLENNSTVLIDMSSPNVAKDMHVGHLRSTMIGNALAKLLDFFGYTVKKINHIGDWGTQFGMLIAFLKTQHLNCESLPEINELQAMYKKAKERFDSDENFAKESLAWVAKLQQGDQEAISIWKKVVDISMNKFEKIYQQLNIEDLETCGESFYQQKMEQLMDEIKSKPDLCEVDEKGRVVMYIPGSDVPLILTKSDGAFTYDTSDLAALKYRLEVLRADKILYVIDAGQGPHMKAIFGGGKKLGLLNDTNFDSKVSHVEFGLVLGEDKKKLKTRSGDSIKLQDLINEAISKATETVKSKQGDDIFNSDEKFWKDVSSKLGIGGIIYQDLCQRRHLDYVFSFERMLNDKGNTAVYLLYAYVRIQSIIRKCLSVDKKVLEKMNALVDTQDLTSSIQNNLHALKLSKMLTLYSQVLYNSKECLQLNNMCDYIYNLSTCFSEFYNHCRIINNSEIDLSYLALSQVTSSVLEKFLYILGISVIEKI